MTPQKTLAVLAVLAFALSGCSGQAAKPVQATMDEKGVQHARITVKGGYRPSQVLAQSGKPLRLEFYRDESDSGHSCGEYLDIPALKVHERLSGQRAEVIEIPPQPAGEMGFQCGMNMLKGKIIFK